MGNNFFGKDYNIFFRVYGAENIEIEKYVVDKELKGVLFKVYKDSIKAEPDSVFALNIDYRLNYPDVYIQ